MLRFRRSTFAVLVLLVMCGATAVLLSVADSRTRGLLVNTLTLAFAALWIAVPAGAFLGLMLARTNVSGRRTAAVLLGGMLLVPLYLQAAAWQAGFGTEGWQTTIANGLQTPWLDGWRGAIWVHGCGGIPWVALFVAIAARGISTDLEESAALDLTWLGVFWRVTIRLSFGAIILGGIWVAVLMMTEMSVTDLFAVRTYAEELYIQLNLGSWNVALNATAADQAPVPALAGVIVTAITAAGAIVFAGNANTIFRKSSAKVPILLELGNWRPWISLTVWALVGAIVLLPLGNLIYKTGATVVAGDSSFVRGWSPWKALTLTVMSPRDFAAELGWSSAMAVGSACLTLAIAVGLAYAARTSNMAAAVALGATVAALAVPGPLVSLGLIAVFNHPRFAGLNYLYDRTIAVAVLAQSVRALPFAMFLAWHALRAVPRSLVEAALLDGAGPVTRMWLVLRQRLFAIGIAGVATAVLSLSELSSTLLVVPPGIEPLSVRLFGLLHYNVEDQVAAITLMLFLVHATAAWLIFAISRRVFA